MFDSILNFFKKLRKENKKDSKDTAKERLHLVLMQDRANVSADFMELMKQEIIEVIKKYIDVDENSIDVKLTNKVNSDGTTGAPILYANIPILNVKDDTKQIHIERKLQKGQEEQKQENKEVQNKKEQNENVEEGKIHKNEEKNSESEAQKQAQEVKNKQQKDAQVVNFQQEENKQAVNNEKEALEESRKVANSEQEKELEEKVQEVDQKQETLAEKNEEPKQKEDKNSNHVEV